MKKFKKFNSIGREELNIATKIIKSGKLSEFLAKKGKFFNGGYYVKRFEKSIEKYLINQDLSQSFNIVSKLVPKWKNSQLKN